MSLGRLIMVGPITLGQIDLQTCFFTMGVIVSTIWYRGWGLYGITTHARGLRLLTCLRDKGTTNCNMVITMGQTRGIIIFVLCKINILQGLNTGAFGIFKRTLQPRGDRVKLQDQTRDMGHVRRSMQVFHSRDFALIYRATSTLNCPREITTRRLVMFKDTGVAHRTRFRGGVICRLLDATLDRCTPVSITFGVSIGRHTYPTRQRDHSILLLSYNGVYGMGPLGHFTHITYQQECIVTMRLHRLLRRFRGIGLLLRLLTRPCSLLYRVLVFGHSFVYLFGFSGHVRAMRNGSTVISCCSTSSMNIKRANRRHGVTYLSRLAHVNSRCSIIIDYLVSRLILSFVKRLVTMDLYHLAYRARATRKVCASTRKTINLGARSGLLFLIGVAKHVNSRE